MSRRGRALAFAAGALLCATLAAAAAGRYEAAVSARLGELRSVVITRSALPARRPISAEVARRRLAVRQVPTRFAPPEALAGPSEAIGLLPSAAIPAGAYLLPSQLRSAERSRRRPNRLAQGVSPVEIEVQAAGAVASLAGGEAPAAHGRAAASKTYVDVVVTTEPRPGERGRTYVAAERVHLLALTPAGGAPGDPLAGSRETWTATLALRREAALRLIEAESFAREVRLIGRR